jgi:Transposase Tn5 dimerisation domain/Transposase DNA-binding
MAKLEDWVSQEIHYSAFDDFRHGKRLRAVVGCLSKHPSQSVPQASEHKSESQSIYRLWANQRVKPEQIRASHRMSVIDRVNQQAIVLAIQDTTDLDFTSHPQTSGLGFIHQGKQQGIKVHSCIGVSGDGEPLGLLAQHNWIRTEPKGKRGQRRKKETIDKESQRWLDTLKASEVGVNAQVKLIHIGDREADIFDLLAMPRQANSELLIRAEHNRKVQQELDYLIPTIEQAAVMGHIEIKIERNPQRSARTACLAMRAMAVTIEVPRHHQQRSTYHPIKLNIILVAEINPSTGDRPIRWLLLTTLPVETLNQVWQCVRWYSLRWLIERFHYTLKSGCKIEQLQLETKDRLLNALATYSIVAWRLMHLTYTARIHPQASCELVLLPAEWKLLRRKFEPKNRSQQPPTLHQAVGWIARLGGFLARKKDGEPGLKTIWRGIGVLHHLLAGSQLIRKT